MGMYVYVRGSWIIEVVRWTPLLTWRVEHLATLRTESDWRCFTLCCLVATHYGTPAIRVWMELNSVGVSHVTLFLLPLHVRLYAPTTIACGHSWGRGIRLASTVVPCPVDGTDYSDNRVILWLRLVPFPILCCSQCISLFTVGIVEGFSCVLFLFLTSFPSWANQPLQIMN